MLLQVSFFSDVFAASRELCKQFNLEYGNTIGTYINIRRPTSKEGAEGFRELYATGTNTDLLRELKKNKQGNLLLIMQANEISEALTDAYHTFLQCPVGKKLSKDLSDRVSIAERRLSNAVHSIEVALNSCGITPGKAFESLKEARFSLKEALTDDPFPSGSFTSADASRIQGAFKQMRDDTTRLTFAVNKACH